MPCYFILILCSKSGSVHLWAFWIVHASQVPLFVEYGLLTIWWRNRFVLEGLYHANYNFRTFRKNLLFTSIGIDVDISTLSRLVRQMINSLEIFAKYTSTLQSLYNTVLYNMDFIITWLHIGSQNVQISHKITFKSWKTT